MRLLIVAEPGRLRDGLQALLDSLGALEPAIVVDGGPSALDAIRNGGPDLVFLDSHLFGVASAEFVRAIKQERPHVYCVVVADRLGQFQPMLDAGADKVLLKGFSAAELSETVEQALDHALENRPGAIHL